MSEHHDDDRTVLSAQAVFEAGLDDWRLLRSTLHARFATGDFGTGLRLVAAIGAAAEAAGHHPDLDLSYPHLGVRLSSHDVGGVTGRDIHLARTISTLAGEVGATATPGRLAVLDLGLDTADHTAIAPFWAALLGYDLPDEQGDEVVDPDGRAPAVWFQPTEPHEVPRQRWHPDVWVPPEVVQDRITAAVAAGGALVDDTAAPSFWVLADPEGNRACLCTWQDREG